MKIPASKHYWPVEPTTKQAAALALYGVPDMLYGGAAGGGKSEFLLMAASQFADHPDSHALLLRKTYKDLTREDALMDRASKWWEHRDDVEYSAKEMKYTFPSGATIEFGHLQNSGSQYQYQGGAYTFIGIDEASQIPREQIDFLRTRLRKRADCPVPLQFRLASNPGNIGHQYLKDRYVDSPNTTKRVFLSAKLEDNPHLDGEQYAEQFDALSPVEKAQLLDGDWGIIATTDFFDLDKIIRVDVVPPGQWRWIRSWDFAATEEEEGKDPAYTAGGRIGLKDGQYCLANVKRDRLAPAEAEDMIIDTAEEDGKSVEIIGEEEGGSSGKYVTSHFSRELVGYVYTGIRPTGSKVERARIVASAIRNRNFYVVDGEWVDAFIEEMRSFPRKGYHKDQVDMLSQGVAHLSEEPQPFIYSRKLGRLAL